MKENNRTKFNFFGRIAFGAVMTLTAASFAANAQEAAKAEEAVVNTETVAAVKSTDIAPPAPSTMPAAQTAGSDSKWTGFYLGGYVGGAWSRSNARTSTVFTEDGYFFDREDVDAINTAGDMKLDPKSFNGGVTFGYNHQFGPIVVGAEADFGSLTNSRTVSVKEEYPCCSYADFTVTQRMKTNWLFTARPRVGVAAGNLMVYGTGGVAVTDLTYEAAFEDEFDFFIPELAQSSAAASFAQPLTGNETGRIDEKRTGWTLGGGAELKLGRRWSVKGEYLYSDFGRVTAQGSVLTDNFGDRWPETPFTHSIGMKVHSARFGVNFHF
jgi:outer membrane immunogenic protein